MRLSEWYNARMLGKMPAYQCGDHVKVEFADDSSGESEWMWLRVDYSDDQKRIVFGRLDSQPVLHTNLKIGQELAVSFDKIRDHQRFELPQS